MPLIVGDTFAGFRIMGLLHLGRMGRVYLVQDPRSLDRRALHVLPVELTTDQEYRARFEREADLAATLSHPNLVGVHDHGEFDGQLWMSTDAVDGIDVATSLRARGVTGMPATEVLDIVDGVASALDYANGNGLPHRHVKPANVLLSQPGAQPARVVLADFGIAPRTDESTGLTATDTALDTVAHAAPEQLMDEPVDGRSDQYALACTTFHMLTGSMPYESSNAALIINKHVMAPPPPIGERRPELAHLNRVFATAMAKDPDDRYPSCQDFARALRRAFETPSAGEPEASGFGADDPPPALRVRAKPDSRPAPRPHAPTRTPQRTSTGWWRRRRRRFSGKRWSNRKILIAVLASVGIVAVTGTTLASVVMPLLAGDAGQVAQGPTSTVPTTTTPAVVIKPLAVRLVVDVPLQANPEDCPPVPPPTPAQEPVRVCDVDKAAVYQLSPVALQLNLTGATSARLPTSEFHTVQMGMDASSSAAFAQYTAGNIGKQIAFVRDGVVLAAPAINQPIDGQSLQISGELTAATADTIARMLRDGS